MENEVKDGIGLGDKAAAESARVVNEAKAEVNKIPEIAKGKKADRIAQALLYAISESKDSGALLAVLLKMGATIKMLSQFNKIQVLHALMFLELTTDEIQMFLSISQDLLSRGINEIVKEDGNPDKAES